MFTINTQGAILFSPKYTAKVYSNHKWSSRTSGTQGRTRGPGEREMGEGGAQARASGTQDRMCLLVLSKNNSF